MHRLFEYNERRAGKLPSPPIKKNKKGELLLYGQVRLVRLQTDKFRLFPRQQTDKRQILRFDDEQRANGLRKIA